MFVIIGTANVDLFVAGFQQMPRVMGDEFTTSSLVFCDDPLQLRLGGNGANCAYVLAELGAPTTLCSAIGQDQLGQLVHAWLAEQGVDLRGVTRRSDRATAYTAIVADQAQNRLAFHHPGALATYELADLPVDLLAAAQVLLISGYTILPQLRPHGFAEALRLAHEHGAITALDIGPAIGKPATLAELTPLLSHVDLLIANQHELAVCTAEADPTVGATKLLAAGARCVILKRGKGGATIFQADQQQSVPAFEVLAHSTVGAGDAFNAGLLYARQQGAPLDEAVRFGNAVAALTVAAPEGILGCPTQAQVSALLAQI